MAKEKDMPLTPLYSQGTSDMDGKENVGKPDGPKEGYKVPDPLGYLKD